MSMLRHVIPALLIALGTGCATRVQPRENIPRYEPLPVEASIAAVRERMAKLTSATGKGAVTLTDASRRSVRLDSVFVLAPPDRARVRAWKFNQAVFDLTVRPDGTWIYAPREREGEGPLTRTSGVGESIRQWLGYLQGDIDLAGASVSSTAYQILITRPQGDGLTLTTAIDRPTLTIRSYRLARGDTEQFMLSLEQYASFGETLWPTRIVARSPSGTIMLDTRELEPNVAPADAAFTPPSRATHLR